MRALILAFIFLAASVRAGTLIPKQPSRWELITIDFEGPETSEVSNPNPFTDYRLDVKFVHEASGVKHVVPGFYAADGNAAHTSAEKGNVWRVRFKTARTGKWMYIASFHKGNFIAAKRIEGTPVFFNGENGHFHVTAKKFDVPDLRSKGRLQYVGQRYYRYANGEYKLKLGTNTPENVLAYKGFDGESVPLTFESHLKDWRSGDPTWGKDERGKEIIGAINYLSNMGVNSLFAILMTVKGDSKGQVHPWRSKHDRSQFDVSKLEQWHIVFEHAERKGISLNFAFCETENEALFEHESGVSKQTGFALSRKVYYREMIARFSNQLGFSMILGEENGWTEKAHHGGGYPWGQGNTHEQRKKFSQYIRSIDPFYSPIGVHTFPPLKAEVYQPMLGPHSGVRMEYASLQMGRKWSTYDETKYWIDQSTSHGMPWVVTADEIGSDTPHVKGGIPIASSGKPNMSFRAVLCWGNIMAGGAGVEVFSATVDQSLSNFREFDSIWAEFSRAIALFQDHNIPFWSMESGADIVTSKQKPRDNQWMYGFAKRGDVYVVYQSGELEPLLNLSGVTGKFQVRWFNPRPGSSTKLDIGSAITVSGGSEKVDVGKPPYDIRRDWAVVVSRTFPLRDTAAKTSSVSPHDLIPGSLTFGSEYSHYGASLSRGMA
ncbi:hypothetical protein BWQ96_02931 [Gracilariopsis chorda]|uniref:DUF5060 domain-containing protein n=1 Tax=Gracilariopsis chorda TaxID=448386 RepID=A0A2V3IYU7_9FLOR|nr:hypothetical protein BWQ96_02931 [Gracilariopsis chorda]|eukprot:PXF47318.1 hypothetical protein BWQ96_02931 [Gracilariopsis chorda]